MSDEIHKRDAVTLANSQLIDWLNEEAECEIASAGELTTLGKKLRAMEVTARRLVREITALLARLEAVTQERDDAFQRYVDANEARIDAEAALADALALPELRALVEAAILDAQLRAFEQRRLDTPDEIKAAAIRALAAQEGEG